MGYKFEKYSIGGGGSGGIIDVTELPTENIDTNAIYKVTGALDVGVYVHMGNGGVPLAGLLGASGIFPEITYFVVDALPESPNVSNLSTFAPAYVYIYNDVPYIYGNLGSGNSWAKISDMFSQYGLTDKGFVEAQWAMRPDDEAGIYVTYKKNLISVPQTYAYSYNDKWLNGFDMLANFIYKAFDHFEVPEGITQIGWYAFALNDMMLWAKIPDSVVEICGYAFYQCQEMRRIEIGNGVKEIVRYAFAECPKLTSILYNGTKAQWKAITKGDYWDEGTPDYIITCTDGTIAKDGTES